MFKSRAKYFCGESAFPSFVAEPDRRDCADTARGMVLVSQISLLLCKVEVFTVTRFLDFPILTCRGLKQNYSSPSSQSLVSLPSSAMGVNTDGKQVARQAFFSLFNSTRDTCKCVREQEG